MQGQLSPLFTRGINKEAITLLPKEKIPTGDTCKCHPEKQDVFYTIRWANSHEVRPVNFPSREIPLPILFKPVTSHNK